MTDYGTDVSTYPDLDATFGLITGPRVVAECVARKLEVILHGALNADATPTSIRAIQVAIQSAATEDERVLDASAAVAHLGEALTASVSLALIQGETFDLTLRISDVTVETVFGVQ